MNLDNHPSVIAFRQRQQNNQPEAPTLQRLKAIVLEAGADDVGVVEIDRPSLQDQKEAIVHAFPRAKTLVSFICRMNVAQIRSNDRSLADGEFIAYDAEMLHISRTIVKALRDEGITAVTPSESFPQDMSKWQGRMLTVSHKPVAEAAGLGMIGHHRLLIHPIFGSHLCLGTIIIDTAFDVCPAGQDLLGPYLDNRKEYVRNVVKPLQERKENVYVLPGQDQATVVSKKFPNKTVRPA